MDACIRLLGYLQPNVFHHYFSENKLVDKYADCGESEYDANYFWKHKNTVSKNPLINNPPVHSIPYRT